MSHSLKISAEILCVMQSVFDYANSILHKHPHSYLTASMKLRIVLLKPSSTRLHRSTHHNFFALYTGSLFIKELVLNNGAVLSFMVLFTQQPAYLCDMDHYDNISRKLRCSDQVLLHQPRTRTTFGM